MEIEFTEEARKDLKQLDSQKLSTIKQKINELQKGPTDKENSKLIQIAGRKIFRLKIKENRGGDIDHRVIYDVGEKVTVYSIFHRDEGYEEEDISNRF